MNQLKNIAKLLETNNKDLSNLHKINKTYYHTSHEAHTVLTQKVQPLGYNGQIIPVYREHIASWRYNVLIFEL